MSPETVGFIGLGMMGAPMAACLVRAGHTLVVGDASNEAVSRFVAACPGVVVGHAPADFAHAPVVITMLPNSDIVESVVLGTSSGAGLVNALPRGATIIDMSSSEPGRTKILMQRLRERGIDLLDAPVSGGVRRAREGALSIMVGGDSDAFARWEPLLRAIGRVIVHVGASGCGHAAKALNNYVSAAGLIATAEAIHAAQAFGVDPQVMADVLNGSTGRNNTTENKLKQFMLSGAFDAGFALDLMKKDLATAMLLADEIGHAMPLGRRVLELWREAADHLPRNADHTAYFAHAAPCPAR